MYNKEEIFDETNDLTGYPFIFDKDNSIENLSVSKEVIKSKKKKLGRKTKNDSGIYDEKTHNKFKIDNINRKIKNMILNSIIPFINSRIKNGFNKLKKIAQKEYITKNVEFDKTFFIKNPIKDILSLDITSKHKKYLEKDYNKKKISFLLSDKNPDKQQFEQILNLTFLDYLEHFRQSKYYPELDGMAIFDEAEIKEKKCRNDKDYYDTFKYTIDNYEELIDQRVIKKRNK